MAVYTHLSDAEIRQFIERYGPFELVEAKGINKGVENTNYLLTVRDAGVEKKLILTLFEQRVKADELPYFLELMYHVALHHIPCPSPLQQGGGAMICDVGEKPAALFTFLCGAEVEQVKNHHLQAVGSFLAQLHLATHNFTGHRENNLAPCELEPLYASVADRLDELQPGLQEAIASDLAGYGDWRSRALPAGVIHADLFRDNVLFTGAQLSGALDFYFACNDFLAYDLMIAMNDWCFDASGNFNHDHARELLMSYHRQRPLSDAEWLALPDLARGGAVRFLLTRAYDLFNQPEGAMVTVKDPMEYVKKWEFHCKVESYRAYLD